MKTPTFFYGIAVAFILSAVGSAAYSMFDVVFSSADAIKIVLAIASGAYAAAMLLRSKVRTGRLIVYALWFIGSVAMWILVPELLSNLVFHAGFVWLVRSLYFHTSCIAALLDLVMTGLGVLAAVAAANHTHSVFLTIWSFFLVQSLFVVIPAALSANSRQSLEEPDREFNRALRTAEAAARRIYNAN